MSNQKDAAAGLKKGLFITCEGGDGAGKSTLIQGLESHCLSRGIKVLTTREPGGTPLGDHIRQLVLKHSQEISISSKAELFLFLAGRAQHIVDVIKPALSQGVVIICDRFNDSTIAYQGCARNLGIEYVQKLCDLVCQGFTPDLTFYLDIDPLEGLKRARGNHKPHFGSGELDRIESEKLEFHHKVREGMKVLAELYPNRIYTLDASKPVQEVLKAAIQQMDAYINRE